MVMGNGGGTSLLCWTLNSGIAASVPFNSFFEHREKIKLPGAYLICKLQARWPSQQHSTTAGKLVHLSIRSALVDGFLLRRKLEID